MNHRIWSIRGVLLPRSSARLRILLTCLCALSLLTTERALAANWFVSVSATASDTNAPAVVDTVPPSGSTVPELAYLEVIFSENVKGVDAADLLVNGKPAERLAEISPRNYIFYFEQPPAGEVKVSWTAHHGITDLASPANPFAGAERRYVLDPTKTKPQVIISEFMADNTAGIRDEDASRGDWIELLNLGPDAVNLDGWYLTDEATNRVKWRFPAVTLGPKNYLVVWASEKDRTNAAAPLHTNFRLAQEGEYLALVDPQTNVVSAFIPQYPPQVPNISYGRAEGDPSMTGYFATPTPGTTNSVSGRGFAPAPVFSLPGGVFTQDSLRVELSAASGEIRYTLDGTIPTAASLLYSDPLVITNNAVISARVFKEGLLPSPLVIHTYTLLADSMTNFSSNLPLLVINTAGRVIPQDRRIRAWVSAFEPLDGRSRLLNQPNFHSTAQVEVRGQTSAGFPKIPYNLEINDPYGNDVEAPLLGLPPESDWALHNPYSDKCLMNNVLTFDLHREMGHYAPRTVFVEVFIKSGGGKLSYPGDYRGVYVLMEKIKIDRSRVDIARMSPLDTSEPDITGGYIVKKDKDSPGDRSFSTVGGGGFSSQSLKYHEPKPREITQPQQTWIRGYINQFERSLYASDWLRRTGTNHYSHYIDQDSFVDYHWIVEFPKQIDGYRLSNYISKDRGEKLKMEPIWDWNLAWGNADYLDGQFTNGWYYSLLGDADHIWLRRMISGTASASGRLGDPDFNQKIADRWSVLRTNILYGSNVVARVESIAAYLAEAADRDFKKYPRLGTYVWPNPPIYVTPRTYSGIISNMNRWILGRFNWIDRQFVRAPELSHAGGRVPAGFGVRLSANSGTIHYTMDGTDPRLPGGAVNPAAKTYDGAPITVNDNARIFARALESTNRWSGPVAGTFVVRTPALAITEIMYNGAPPPAGSANSTEDFSFVELRNVSSSPMNLVGFKFTSGIDFTFTAQSGVTTLQPGAYVLVVKNRAAFVSRHPGVSNIAGEYSGSLDNNGERLALQGSLQETVADFVYSAAWHPATDGHGFSLVAVNENALSDLSQRSSWRASSRVGGSPGQSDPPPPAFPTVLVNEVLSDTAPPQSDAVELFNAGAAPANIGGWFLTDDADNPKKYRVPDGTTIPSGGFLVLDEQRFNAGANGFSFSAEGEEVYLFSGDGSNLTGYAHGFEFGATSGRVGFGRHVTSTGGEHFVAQRQATLGAANAGPLVGPLVISELMYHPPAIGLTNNTLDEFVEIRNVTANPVRLFDPVAPTNTWRLRGGVDFDFPTNATLAAQGFALVVQFNPATEPNTLANFRAKYGLDASVPIFGPYTGNLSNEGEEVRLSRPGVAPILVDAVNYSSNPPWPSGASGTGASLQRRATDQYGNDPAHWLVASPTAGRPTGTAPSGDSDGDGLPDEWEMANFGNLASGANDDPDRDGSQNRDEFIAGTHPRDPLSVLRVESLHVSGGGARLSFKAMAGNSYSVLYRDDLFQGTWTKLADVPAQATTRDAQITDTTARLRRFYRLVTPQSP